MISNRFEERKWQNSIANLQYYYNIFDGSMFPVPIEAKPQ